LNTLLLLVAAVAVVEPIMAVAVVRVAIELLLDLFMH
jgi:hypothetical protein